jgi:hypothetical protein
MLNFNLNQNNWEEIGSFNLVASQTQSGAHIPIVPQDLPIQSERRLLAIHIACEQARLSWSHGGWVLQKIFTGLGIGGVNDGVYYSKRLLLREINLVQVDLPVSSYALRFIIPQYFPSWQCSVFQYTGEITDHLDSKLDGIVESLATIQTDLTAHNGN